MKDLPKEKPEDKIPMEFQMQVVEAMSLQDLLKHRQDVDKYWDQRREYQQELAQMKTYMAKRKKLSNNEPDDKLSDIPTEEEYEILKKKCDALQKKIDDITEKMTFPEDENMEEISAQDMNPMTSISSETSQLIVPPDMIKKKTPADHKRCQICRKTISTISFQMHEINCMRNFTKCKHCQLGFHRRDYEQHFTDMHKEF
eukprot:UN33791